GHEAPSRIVFVFVQQLGRNMVVSIGKNCCGNINPLSDVPTGGISSTVNLWLNVLNDNALTAFDRFHSLRSPNCKNQLLITTPARFTRAHSVHLTEQTRVWLPRALNISQKICALLARLSIFRGCIRNNAETAGAETDCCKR